MARGQIPLREEGELEDINGKAFTFLLENTYFNLKWSQDMIYNIKSLYL
jgi:hypothetical protein